MSFCHYWQQKENPVLYLAGHRTGGQLSGSPFPWCSQHAGWPAAGPRWTGTRTGRAWTPHRSARRRVAQYWRGWPCRARAGGREGRGREPEVASGWSPLTPHLHSPTDETLSYRHWSYKYNERNKHFFSGLNSALLCIVVNFRPHENLIIKLAQK